MCLAVPGKVIRTYDENGILMGDLDFGGISKSVCLAYIPDIKVDEYVLVHAGFALQRIDEQEVHTFYRLWQEVLKSGNNPSLPAGDSRP
jgi:hydrogenase expression/formation protein HypC